MEQDLGPDLSAGALSDGPRRVRALAAGSASAKTWQRCSPIRSRRSMMPGLVDLVDTDHRICDEISLVPTLGSHAGPCQRAYRLEGEEALITGDFMHHPCQIARPDWSSTADSDPERGAPHPRAHAGRAVRPSGAGDRHSFRRRHRRPYRARRRGLPARRVTHALRPEAVAMRARERFDTPSVLSRRKLLPLLAPHCK